MDVNTPKNAGHSRAEDQKVDRFEGMEPWRQAAHIVDNITTIRHVREWVPDPRVANAAERAIKYLEKRVAELFQPTTPVQTEQPRDSGTVFATLSSPMQSTAAWGETYGMDHLLAKIDWPEAYRGKQAFLVVPDHVYRIEHASLLTDMEDGSKWFVDHHEQLLHCDETEEFRPYPVGSDKLAAVSTAPIAKVRDQPKIEIEIGKRYAIEKNGKVRELAPGEYWPAIATIDATNLVTEEQIRAKIDLFTLQPESKEEAPEAFEPPWTVSEEACAELVKLINATFVVTSAKWNCLNMTGTAAELVITDGVINPRTLTFPLNREQRPEDPETWKRLEEALTKAGFDDIPF